MASATTVTAVGAVAGITGTGASASNAQTPDEVGSTASRLLDVPGAAQVLQMRNDVLTQANAQSTAYDEAQRFQAAEAARVQVEKAAAEKAAAEKAVAEKVAAEKAAAAKASADRAAQAASRSTDRTTVSGSSGDPKAIARALIGNATQFQCFSNIVSRESGWSVTATNASSGAYGLVQALPGSKMASAGSDWRTNAATQIKWGLSYMNSRYGSPCGAWSFWQEHNWY